MSTTVKGNTLINKTSIKRVPFNKAWPGDRGECILILLTSERAAKATMATISGKGLLWVQGLNLAQEGCARLVHNLPSPLPLE